MRLKTKPPNPVVRLYLYEQRKRLNLSVYQITKRLIVSSPYYYRLENGTRGHRLDVVMLYDLSKALEADFETFCKEELKYQQVLMNDGLRFQSRETIVYESN